jgi:pimeloyl-ACP methyl ester carboxylesterase
LNAAAHLPSRRPARIALLAVVAMLGALLLASGAEAKKVPEGPKGGAFYKPPKKLPKGHGKIIWQRDATKLVPIETAKVNKTILYTSKSPQGKRVAVSGALSIPKGKPPKGGWPVISWAHGTTGIADSCAPTRIRPNSAYSQEPQLADWVDAGYAVVRTDYQGLGTPGVHPYLVGKAEGRSVLDMVSAARQYKPVLSKKFLVAGHSQGGQSALFAANLAKSWSPGLKFRGVASYAPGSHFYEQKELLPALTAPSGLSAIAALILKGAMTTNKAIDPDELLTSEALALFPQVNQICLPALGQPDSFGGIPPADLIQPSADTGPLDKALKKMNPALKVDKPVLVLQGESDTTALPFYTDMLVGELMDEGDDVDYQTYPGIDHGGIVPAAEDAAMDFFQQQLPSSR